MTYSETLDWLFEQLPMYQRQGKTAFKKDLTNVLALSEHLLHPENKFKSIHVAGTNGKGSSSHMLASILQEAGYKVGLYTSPHLKDFRERIKVDGKCIRKNCVINFIKRNKKFLEQQGLSFFEMTVGMAFEHFAKQQIDIAIVEVGLGGRLDSTNIITPEVSVITNIGFDHTQFLGNTLAEIAFEKAGIIKESIPVVIGEFHSKTFPIFEKIATEKKSDLILAENLNKEIYPSDLKGNYQQYNIKTVMQTIEILLDKGWKINQKQLKLGLLNVVENTGLQGRWQILDHNPKIICDTAHNKEGLQYTLEQLTDENYKQLHIVIGVVDDKSLETILPLFPKDAIYYFCKAQVPRALNASILANQAFEYKLIGQVYASVKEALFKAKKSANPSDLIYVGGSTFVVAEVL
jgi:dihydrofolate synthase/folylpolyglutamate synthase